MTRKFCQNHADLFPLRNPLIPSKEVSSLVSRFSVISVVLTNLIPLTLSLSLFVSPSVCLFVFLFSLYLQAPVSDLLGSGPGCPLRDSELLPERQHHQGSHVGTVPSDSPAHTLTQNAHFVPAGCRGGRADLPP